jgi:hypothetical protein
MGSLFFSNFVCSFRRAGHGGFHIIIGPSVRDVSAGLSAPQAADFASRSFDDPSMSQRRMRPPRRNLGRLPRIDQLI